MPGSLKLPVQAPGQVAGSISMLMLALWVCLVSWKAKNFNLGVADLPAEDLQMVKDTLAMMLAGEFDRFDVFTGPIVDNNGNTVL